jgi:RNA polymerase sigma-70 factor (ECF subfamily)
MVSNPDADDPLVVRIHAGDRQALGEFFARNRDRLRGMVRLRLDRRLQGRLDPDDVLQDAFVDAARRLGEYAVLVQRKWDKRRLSLS